MIGPPTESTRRTSGGKKKKKELVCASVGKCSASNDVARCFEGARRERIAGSGVAEAVGLDARKPIRFLVEWRGVRAYKFRRKPTSCKRAFSFPAAAAAFTVLHCNIVLYVYFRIVIINNYFHVMTYLLPSHASPSSGRRFLCFRQHLPERVCVRCTRGVARVPFSYTWEWTR